MAFDPAERSNDDLKLSSRDDGRVLIGTIDRPERRNALNRGVFEGLHAALEAAEEGPARVLVIRGAEGSFSSGADLAEGAEAFDEDASSIDVRDQFSGLARIVRGLREAPVLTVAAIEGYCMAGGLGLAAACDFLIAEENATLGTPEVNVGLFPAQALAPIMEAVQEKKGLQLLFTGESIDASRAESIGLITEAVPGDDFEDRLSELVDRLAANSPVLIRVGKQAYYQSRGMPFDQSLSYLQEIISLIAMSHDAREGITAFLEDREPEWSGH